MWFLGAGTSRTAGMPTANDICWDLKRKYYCLKENQEIQFHDINNKAIRHKIQEYMISKGFPSLLSDEEYSFYFNLIFGKNYELQQKYIIEQLDRNKISLNIGHRVLAALIKLDITRVIFTTNFDEVIEEAFAYISGNSLTAYHLEGSYAALDALNSERFPIYAKIHGDFRFRSIKNLAIDLIDNDQNIQKCFLASSNRFGVVVAGYSGRDSNVMNMFRTALDQGNPFPHGLFWTKPVHSQVSANVCDLIEIAKQKGVQSGIVEIGTFDTLLSKIWRQLANKPYDLDQKVRYNHHADVNIPFPSKGNKYPLLRFNAFPIIECPHQCMKVEYDSLISFKELKDKEYENRPDLTFTYLNEVLFWGNSNEINKLLDKNHIVKTSVHTFENPIKSISESTFIKSFYENALAKALCNNKPLLIRLSKNNTLYVLANHANIDDPIFNPLKRALDQKGGIAAITGNVPLLKDTYWSEAISVNLEERDGLLWLLVKPDIWISPIGMRKKAIDFLRNKKLKRYNNHSYQLLNSWIEVLFGSFGNAQVVNISCYTESDNHPVFKINTRTAFSLGG